MSSESLWRQAEKGVETAVKLPCRICHSVDETDVDPLVAPCRCDGSLRYVHNSCQQAWLCSRRGPLEYRCELCRARLYCRVTFAVRVELVAVSVTTATLWAAQAASTSTVIRLAVRLLISSRATPGREGGLHALFGASLLLRRVANWLPPPASLSATCDALSRGAVEQLVFAAAVVVVAHSALTLVGRPLAIGGEDALTRSCVVKIGGSVLVLLHEVLWAFPPTQQAAPQPAWRVMGVTLLLDTLLLAFLRVPLEERKGCLWPKLLRLACRVPRDFLPCAAIFFLWSTSILMIAVASVVPCTVLLFHEAFRELRRSRHQHGSVQLAVLVARMALRISALVMWGPAGAAPAAPAPAAPAPRALRLCERALALGWLAVELRVAFDLVALRRVAACAREASSQAMWSIAFLGQAVFVAHDIFRSLASTWPPGLQLPQSGPPPGSGESLGHRAWDGHLRGAGMQVPGSSTRGFQQRLEEVAALLSLFCYLLIHAPVVTAYAKRVRQALMRALTEVPPDQVIFYDRPHSRKRTH